MSVNFSCEIILELVLFVMTPASLLVLLLLFNMRC